MIPTNISYPQKSFISASDVTLQQLGSCAIARLPDNGNAVVKFFDIL